MDQERLEKWYELQQEGLERVRAGNPPDPRESALVLRVLITPSFDPAVHWEIYQSILDDGSDGYFAVYTVWRMDIDLEKMEAPDPRLPVERRYRPLSFTPTIETQNVPLNSASVENLLTLFKKLTISAFVQGPPNMGGLDGTSYEIAFQSTLGIAANYYWWSEPPAGWKALGKFLSDLVAYLENQR